MKTNRLATVERTLEVLSMFREKREYTLQEITDLLNMSKTVVFRTLYTLESMGYLIKDPHTKAYTLGYEVYRLGKSFEESHMIRQTVYPIVKELFEKVNETVGFIVPDYNKLSAVQVIELETNHPVKHTLSVSRILEFHTGAARKTLMAHLGKETIELIINANQNELNHQKKIGDIDALLKELAQIRNQGYGESESEVIRDVYAISAPVFGYKNEIIGSLGIHLPTYRIGNRRLEFIDLVKLYGEKISKKLQ